MQCRTAHLDLTSAILALTIHGISNRSQSDQPPWWLSAGFHRVEPDQGACSRIRPKVLGDRGGALRVPRVHIGADV